ncbi:MAG: hypothetical protein NZ580_06705, partial [Bacteroidia bacterium]|nr:hypothetical protein [Bacteroidia bacterium]
MRYLLLFTGLFSLLWAQSPEPEPSLFFLQEGGRYFIVLSVDPIPTDKIEVLDLTGKRIHTFALSSENDKRYALPEMPEG